MNYPSQEDLLGYVLGALDAQEHRDLQQHLDENPETEDELLAIKASMVPLDMLEAPGHRPGLARRTCELVANYDSVEAAERLSFLDAGNMFADEDSDTTSSPIKSNQPAATPPAEASLAEKQSSKLDVTVSPPNNQTPRAAEQDNAPVELANQSKLSGAGGRFYHPSSWSLTDALVGVALLAIIACVLLPTISWTRYNSRVFACQNNLRQVGTAFMLYSSSHDGNFVSIPPEGNLSATGCYGPILKDAGFLTDDSLLACAGLGSSVAPVVIPSCQRVTAAFARTEVIFLQQNMGGHFGYSMGHRKDSGYAAPRDSQTYAVLLADRPSADQPGRVSMNHSGRGQNCLFADGRVEFVVGHAYGSDALFENDYGVVAPGSTEFDNVIAPSHLSPSLGIEMSLAPAE